MTERWTAARVRESLALLWPDGEWVRVDEAGADASRQGRKADVVSIAMWQSRGFEVNAVEIKVSMADWRRELDRGAKADWWWRHSHRFWVAVPDAMAGKVRAELPDGWGLLACPDAGRPRKVVAPPARTPEPLPTATWIGLVRGAQDAGPNALMRARRDGYRDGVDAGRVEAERSAPGAADDRLRRRVAEFEKESGLSLDSALWRAEAFGRLAHLVHRSQADPEALVRQFRHQSEQLARLAAGLGRLAGSLDRATAAEPESGAA